MTQSKYKNMKEIELDFQKKLQYIVASKSHFILAYILDAVIIMAMAVVPVFYMIDIMVENDTISSEFLGYVLVVLGLLVYMIVTLIFKGHTPAKLLLGLRYRTLKGAHKITVGDYLNLAFTNWALNFKYVDWFKGSEFLNSKLSQTMAMKQEGIILVPVWKLKRLDEHTKKMIEQKRALSAQQALERQTNG